MCGGHHDKSRRDEGRDDREIQAPFQFIESMARDLTVVRCGCLASWQGVVALSSLYLLFFNQGFKTQTSTIDAHTAGSGVSSLLSIGW